MKFQKFKTNSYCVGPKHYSGTKNIVGGIAINKETGTENNFLFGQCWICNRKKSMIVSDNTIQAEGLGSFFKILGKISAKAGKNLATNVLGNPSRALESSSNIATAAATKNLKAYSSSLPELINFYHTGKVYTWTNFYNFCYISGTKKRQIISICTTRE